MREQIALTVAGANGCDYCASAHSSIGAQLGIASDELDRNLLGVSNDPKTQAALLQAMQECEVSFGTQTFQLKPPFFVVATQNPIEMEGTYPLPEAQVDRFMFNLRVKYPSVAEEVQIMRGTTSTLTAEANKVMASEEVIRLQDLVRGVPVAESVLHYVARLVAHTRPSEVPNDDAIHKYISYGASPRASQGSSTRRPT